jgi:hypothetical protein
MTQPKVPTIKMPGVSRIQMPTPLIETTLNPAIFEQFIKAQGVRMIHSRPVPCPYVRSLANLDHDPACPNCFNGFVYYHPTEFIGAFMGNMLERKFGLNGTWDVDQCQIIVPVYNQQNELMDVQYFDQIMLPDAPLVRYYQRVEHNQSGMDRLHFPAVTVDFLIDSAGKRYRPDVDFVISQGKIQWIGNRPGWDPTLDRGIVYSVNYYTRPTFTVLQLPHHLRLAQTMSPEGVGAPNVTARFPQLAVCRKDFIPYDSTDKVGEPDTPEPREGSFGPST